MHTFTDIFLLKKIINPMILRFTIYNSRYRTFKILQYNSIFRTLVRAIYIQGYKYIHRWVIFFELNHIHPDMNVNFRELAIHSHFLLY